MQELHHQTIFHRIGVNVEQLISFYPNFGSCNFGESFITEGIVDHAHPVNIDSPEGGIIDVFEFLVAVFDAQRLFYGPNLVEAFGIVGALHVKSIGLAIIGNRPIEPCRLCIHGYCIQLKTGDATTTKSRIIDSQQESG